MGFSCGIVGLPNVGKSTLFNALTATAAADAANYPFCTIEPNLGRVAVPDERLEIAARLAKSPKVVPTQLEFVDIAGLVRGASRGEGLGNQFLGHIREVDAIAHVLRCFPDGGVVHIEGSVDPIRDAETVETELMLADLDSLERRVPQIAKRARGGDRAARAQLDVAETVLAALHDGTPARDVAVAPEREKDLKALQLLSAKPVLYIANVDEASAACGNADSARAVEYAGRRGARSVVIAAAIEAELRSLPMPTKSVSFSLHSGSTSRASPASSAPATGSLTSSPFLRSVPRRLTPGRSRRGPKPRGRPGASIPISRKASSAPRPSATPILSPVAGNRVPKTPAACT